MSALLKRLPVFFILTITSGCPLLSSPTPTGPPSSVTQRGLPVIFEPNHGQVPTAARYVARTSEGEALLLPGGLEIVKSQGTQSQIFRLNFVGANPADINEESSQDGVANYYRGQNRASWIEHVPLYRAIRYRHIYPNTDLVFHGSGNRLEYDFELAPKAEPARLQIDFDNASQLDLQPDGSLLVENDGQKLRLLAPKAFQRSNGDVEQTVQVSYRRIGSHRVGFALGPYNSAEKLVIDPVVSYANLLGSSASAQVAGIATDKSGNLIMTGNTYASNYPVVNGLPSESNPSEEVVVTKLDPTGENIVYSTYLPASGFSTAGPVAVDSNGNAYVTGVTGGSDFPVTSQNLGTCSDFCNAGFVTKLDPTGKLVYSTLLASGQMLPKAVAVNSLGNVFISGLAADASLKTVNAFQPTYTGGLCTSCNSAFFAELNTSGTSYVFSSYLGSQVEATGIALDTSGNLYVAGSINTPYQPAVPLMDEFQSVLGGFFLTKFASDGKTLLFGSFLGGYGYGNTESLVGVAVGSDGTVYLAGNTSSTGFPYTVNAYRHPLSDGSARMFAMAINPALTALKYSTDLGDGFMNSMAVDTSGHLFAAGSANIAPIASKDAIVSDIATGGMFLELDATGNPIQTSGFGGHLDSEIPTAMSIDTAGNIYLAGNTTSSSSAFQFSCGTSDPVIVGAAAYTSASSQGSTCGATSIAFFTKVASSVEPQISLGYTLPFLPLHNVGSADLHISNISVSGSLSKIWGNCGATVPAGTSCVLTLTDANGKLAQGSVTITSDASPSVQTFTPYLNSSLVGSPVQDFFWADTSQLYFQPQQTGTSSAPSPLRLWNVGVANLSLQAIAAQGSLLQTHDCTAILAPGTYCTVQVVWKPNSNGGGSYVSVNYDNGLEADYYIPSEFLTSITPLLVSQANNIPFGTQTVGHPSLYRTITITNASNTQASPPNISVSGDSSFTLAGNTCTADLAPKQSCVVAALFTPVIDGDSSATLDISGGASASINMYGTGQIGSAVTVSPLELQWFMVELGNSYAQNVTLANTSTAAVSISGFAFSLFDYSETDNCNGSLAPAASCTVSVKFQPQDIGTRNATMTINFGGQTAAQILPLSGQSVYPIAFSVASLDFGIDNPVGSTSAAQQIILENDGNTSVPYALSITGPFVLNNPCANPLAAFSGCIFSVSFKPVSAGVLTGSLTVKVPNLTETSSIPLSGTAIPVLPMPLFTPGGGAYTSAQTVELSEGVSGATIYYTTDGSTPTTTSAKYTGAIAVFIDETIKAIAVASGYTSSSVASATYTISVPPPPSIALQFVPIAPCRITDTRTSGPELSAGATRYFDVLHSSCGIPSTAVAYSLNITAIPDGYLNYLTLWPTGESQPYVSTLNSDGRIKANASITPAGIDGDVSIYASNATNVILDINGYFVPAGTASALAFYPVTPCRIADTRNAAGPLGGPSISAGGSRSFSVPSGSCGIPSTAKAYALNVTAVPHTTLDYLTVWPTGENQPYVSTLNALTGAVTANASIVSAGTSGEISIFASDDSDVILDVNGYFAPPASGGLSLYMAPPCRVIDTRQQSQAFPGTLTVDVGGSACAPSSKASAYVLNATVVPTGSFSYLTLWPTGENQPYVSTLDAYDGAIASNMSIVPANNKNIDAYSSGSGNLILDLFGYFAP